MKFYKYLYVGDSIEHIGIIKQKLKIHAMVNVYLVTLANGDDQLEIYSSMLLKQKYFRKHAPIIIGIAAEYEEADLLVQRIVEESLERTGKCDLKEYLKLKVEDQKKGS